MKSLWTQEARAGTPYWWEEATPRAPDCALPATCDVLVVGAGYAGLSAALAAHETGARVVVVDKGIPGEGASSRNGGMFGAHPRLGWETLAQQYGPEVADGIFAEAAPALDWVKDLITLEKIDCDLQETGRIQLAWTKAHFAGQERLAARVREKSAVDLALVPREALGEEINTRHYHGGLLFPQHCAIHPAKFHQGLLEAVLARDIPVVAHAEVTARQKEGLRHVVTTAKGEISADKLVLCTNGYTTAAFRWHMARVFPLPSYLIATEPLSGNLLGELAPAGRMMVETRARHSYFRLSPDGTRILFGGRAAMVNLAPELAAQRLRQTMCEIWPALEDVALSHVWSGNTGYSFGHMPHVGGADGVFHAMGFSGSGTVMAPYLGAKAAFMAVGDARASTAYARTRLKRHVLHPFRRPHFLQAADRYYRHWVDRFETRAGGR